MQALANEQYTPEDQKGKEPPTSYTIKALSSLQLTEVMTSGFEIKGDQMRMEFKGIMLLLKYGLDDPTAIQKMPSSHHVEVAMAIYRKANLAEEERKNS